jgi:NAD(P)-dependent dehydrogenase (short-subunit alcohol dehydrogenase family)
MAKLLEGKRALVTGASRGLGRAIGERFAAEGARVAFTWTRDEAGKEATLAALRATSAACDARAYRVANTDEAGTEAMLRELEAAWGAVDVLVNNAGITQNLPLALMDTEDFAKVIDVNVKGTFVTTRAALRGMIRRKAGAILNVGSLAGSRMIEAPVHYATSKAAVKGMTEAVAKEVARYGIRVLCLAPGLLEDGVGRNLPDHRVKDYLKHCALGRVGTFAEVAALAAFLVSDANGYMTGETVICDGGV